MLESGPTVVSGSNGSPTFAPAKTAAYVAMNSSATLSVTRSPWTRTNSDTWSPALSRGAATTGKRRIFEAVSRSFS